MLDVILLYALFASVFTVSKIALSYAAPLFLVGSRMLVAGLLLSFYGAVRSGIVFPKSKKIWGGLFKVALFNIYLTNVFEFWGLQTLPSFKVCFLYSLSPFLSAFFCYFLFGDQLNRRKWLGLVVGFLGFAPIFLWQSVGSGRSLDWCTFSLADGALCMGIVCSVYGWIGLMELVKEQGVSPLIANGWSMWIGGTVALFHSWLAESWNPIPVLTSGQGVVLECTLFLILVSNCICYNLYGHLLKKYSPTFLSFAGLMTPVFCALYGMLFLQETITWPFYCSFPMVLAGLYIFNREELKKGVYLSPVVLQPV